jgi:hypothetical protein
MTIQLSMFGAKYDGKQADLFVAPVGPAEPEVIFKPGTSLRLGTPPELARCPECGNELPPKAKACPNCYTKVAKVDT